MARPEDKRILRPGQRHEQRAEGVIAVGKLSRNEQKKINFPPGVHHLFLRRGTGAVSLFHIASSRSRGGSRRPALFNTMPRAACRRPGLSESSGFRQKRRVDVHASARQRRSKRRSGRLHSHKDKHVGQRSLFCGGFHLHKLIMQTQVKGNAA